MWYMSKEQLQVWNRDSPGEIPCVLRAANQEEWVYRDFRAQWITHRRQGASRTWCLPCWIWDLFWFLFIFIHLFIFKFSISHNWETLNFSKPYGLLSNNTIISQWEWGRLWHKSDVFDKMWHGNVMVKMCWLSVGQHLQSPRRWVCRLAGIHHLDWISRCGKVHSWRVLPPPG